MKRRTVPIIAVPGERRKTVVESAARKLVKIGAIWEWGLEAGIPDFQIAGSSS